MKIRIGSRGSDLAAAQAKFVGSLIQKVQPDADLEFVHVSTQGDRDKNSALQKIGGKGVFVKEVESALVKKEIDVAVHSLKDVPQMLPNGLILAPAPPREDPREAVVSRFGEMLAELPRNSTIGTGSPRRQAQIKFMFKSKYRVAPMRGNVPTRLKKVESGEFDSTVMAVAGLKRLGLVGEITEILEIDRMLPAPCQGLLGLELREEDDDVLGVLEKIKDKNSDFQMRAERAFLQALGGDCLVPVAAHSWIEDEMLTIRAVLLDPEGTKLVRAIEKGPMSDAELIGAKAAGRILAEGGSEILIHSNEGAPRG